VRFIPPQQACDRQECQRQRRRDYHGRKLAKDLLYHKVALESRRSGATHIPNISASTAHSVPEAVVRNRVRDQGGGRHFLKRTT